MSWAVACLLTVQSGTSWAQHWPGEKLLLPTTAPASQYKIVDAFPGLSFRFATERIVSLAVPQGRTNELFVTSQFGRIFVITNLLAPTKTVFLDLSSVTASEAECGLTGLAFHPRYAENRLFYVFYTRTNRADGRMYDTVSRFETDPENPWRALRSSEQVLISQRDSNPTHQGGDLLFDADGYLYVSLGDGGGLAGAKQNGERIDGDFFSGILRLDVDERPGSLPPNPHPAVAGGYRIPSDNPYIGATVFNGLPVQAGTLRTEFWAVGLRNPYRMSFDPATGSLYTGDLGEANREEVNRIVPGGNYGWHFLEGSIDFGAGPPPGLTFDPPLYEYGPRMDDSNFEGRSVIGGVVYRGMAYPELYGKYLFGDYISRHIWALNPESPDRNGIARIATALNGPTAFLIHPGTDELLMVERVGRITKLVRDLSSQTTAYPKTLSALGAFSDLAGLKIQEGMMPYDVASSFWSDHAIKTRWFALPGRDSVIRRNSSDEWSFPTGTIWVKHFDLELTRGEPSTRRRLETRFLVKTDDAAYGITYRWRLDGSDADLVPDAGMNETISVREGNTVRNQVWRYPGRSECLNCHLTVSGNALGFSTRQLNLTVPNGGAPANQLALLNNLGLFDPPFPATDGLSRLADVTDESATLEHRFRSYVDINCAYCHQPEGPGRGGWDGRFTTPLSESGILDGAVVDDLGIPDSRVVKAGDVKASALWRRIAEMGQHHMPPLGTTELNAGGVELVRRFIEGDDEPVTPPGDTTPTPGGGTTPGDGTGSETPPAENPVPPANTPPQLATIPSQRIDVGSTLSVQLVATDSDLPGNVLRFSLVSAPPGMTLSEDGLLEWTPELGPSVNTVVIRVSDDQTPALSAEAEFTVAVENHRTSWQIGNNEPVGVSVLKTYGEFAMQNNRNDAAPGVVTRRAGDPRFDPNANPKADDDFYFAGVYPPGFNGLQSPLVVPFDEPAKAWEQSHTIGDRTNRFHFHLAGDQVADGAWMRLTFEFAFGGVAIGNKRQPGFQDHDFVVNFVNGEGKSTRIYSRRISKATIVNLDFSAVQASATPGPNTIELIRTGPVKLGLSYWLTYDYVRLNVTASGNTEPTLENEPDALIDANSPFALFLTAQDNDKPEQELTFSLIDGPAGLTVSPSGELSWVPEASQSKTTNLVAVRVTDNGVPPMSGTNEFQLIVRAPTDSSQPPPPLRTLWQIGDERLLDVPAYFGYAEFGRQNNRNDPPPGAVTRLPDDPLSIPDNQDGPDDDFYFAGIYSPGFNGLEESLLVTNDEPPSVWERCLTIGDRTNRIHFVLDQAQVDPGARLRFTVAFATSGSTIDGVVQPGHPPHDLEFRFRNGNGVETPIYAASIDSPTTVVLEATAAQLAATSGGNSLELVRTGPNSTTISVWLSFDFVRIEALNPVAEPVTDSQPDAPSDPQP